LSGSAIPATLKDMIVRGNIECGNQNRYQTGRVRKETGGDREAGEKRARKKGATGTGGGNE